MPYIDTSRLKLFIEQQEDFQNAQVREHLKKFQKLVDTMQYTDAEIHLKKILNLPTLSEENKKLVNRNLETLTKFKNPELQRMLKELYNEPQCLKQSEVNLIYSFLGLIAP